MPLRSEVPVQFSQDTIPKTWRRAAFLPGSDSFIRTMNITNRPACSILPTFSRARQSLRPDRRHPRKSMQIRNLGPADAAAFQALRLRGLLECPTSFASSYEEEYRDDIEIVAE